jgi:hypothetical protein
LVEGCFTKTSSLWQTLRHRASRETLTRVGPPDSRRSRPAGTGRQRRKVAVAQLSIKTDGVRHIGCLSGQVFSPVFRQLPTQSRSFTFSRGWALIACNQPSFEPSIRQLWA